jgi:hypothetical protein
MRTITTTQAAEILGVTRQQVGRLVAAGALARVPSPCGCVLVDEEQVRARVAAPPRRGRPREPIAQAAAEGPPRVRVRLLRGDRAGEVVDLDEGLALYLEPHGYLDRVA